MLYRVSRLREKGRVLAKSEVQPPIVLNVVWSRTCSVRGAKYSRLVDAFSVSGHFAWQRLEWPPLFDPYIARMDTGMAITGTEVTLSKEDGHEVRHEHLQVWWCSRATDADVDEAERHWRPPPTLEHPRATWE